jgi:hypothetical protein
MSATLTLQQTAIANASGVATIQGFQAGAGRRGLNIASVALDVDPSPPIPQAAVYKGAVVPGSLLASKTAGDRGTFSGQDDVLWPGELLIVQWTGCASGAVCTAILRGQPR